MANSCVAGRMRWALTMTVLWAVSLAALLVEPARAGKLEELDTSLKLIPADAAFYGSSLRNREQIEAIANSKAWAKLKSMPLVQMGLALYNFQAANPQSVPGQIQARLNDPEGRKLIDLAVDMTSDEVFFYGDQSLIGFLDLAQQMAGAMRYGPAVVELTGQDEDLRQEERQARLVMTALVENIDLLKVPDGIVGFKLDNVDLAAEQLDKLEELATPVLEAEPLTQGRLKKADVDGHKYLTLTLDGTMIPWDEVPLDEIREVEPEEGDTDKLVDKIKKSTLVIALGIRDDYLLLSIGSSTDCLTRLGKGERLVDRKEIKPLEKFADERIRGLGYVSQQMMSRLANGKRDVDQLLTALDEILPEAELEPEQKAKIRKDATALAEDLKRLIPDPGAVAAVEFLTDRGIEGYQYYWGDRSQLDGSKPLGLLSHVGRDPFLAVVARGKHSPKDYDLLVKWGKTAYDYFLEFALPEMSSRERRQFNETVKLVGPLLRRMDEINRKMLIPALDDGQAGLVIDTKLTSERFAEALPATEEPMPMLEPALVIGVSDAKLLRKACVEYRKVFDDLIEAIREIEADAIPEEFEIPDPQVTESEAGTIYGYSLPEEWGVDEQIVPNFGLSQSVAVLSISRDHTQRLLKAAPLEIGGVLTEPDRPLAMASFIDCAGFIDTLTPWIDLAVEKISEASGGGGGGLDFTAGLGMQVHIVLDVLKVFRCVTSEVYFEDDAVVTHTLFEIRDIPE